MPGDEVMSYENKPLILIVDDELTHLRLTEIMLVNDGYRIMTAEHPREALDLLSDFKPDLLIMDVNMPGLSGTELTGRIRAIDRLQDVPIILVTSHVTDRVRAVARERGVDMVLEKPLDMSQFKVKVRETIRSRAATA